MSRRPQDPTGGSAAGEGGAAPEKRRSRWLYVRVLIVQAVSLIALYLLQAVYGS